MCDICGKKHLNLNSVKFTEQAGYEFVKSHKAIGQFSGNDIFEDGIEYSSVLWWTPKSDADNLVYLYKSSDGHLIAWYHVKSGLGYKSRIHDLSVEEHTVGASFMGVK